MFRNWQRLSQPLTIIFTQFHEKFIFESQTMVFNLQTTIMLCNPLLFFSPSQQEYDQQQRQRFPTIATPDTASLRGAFDGLMQMF